MRISQISFSRTLNLGNYNSGKVDCVVDLDPGDDPEQAAMIAKEFLARQLKQKLETLGFETASRNEQRRPDDVHPDGKGDSYQSPQLGGRRTRTGG